MANEKWIWIIPVLFSGCLGLAIGMSVEAQDAIITSPTPPGIEVIRIPLAPVAVDLEVVGEDRLILWSDGRITTISNCPADLNGDGKVGTPDRLIMLGAWGDCP